MKLKTGWIPDILDSRDYKYKRKCLCFKPQKIDLSKYCSPVEDQRTLGSCTAQALVGNMEYLDYRDDKKHTDLSRLFVYYNERMIEGTINQDSGAYIRDGIKSLHKYGVCPEVMHPYNISKFKIKPTQKCYEEAVNRKISSYMRVNGVTGIISSICEYYPVVFGISLYESFQSIYTARTGIVNMPKRTESLIGGHAIMATGFDRKERRFICRNSFGIQWGKNGYFTIPFDYVSKLGRDFWTIRK